MRKMTQSSATTADNYNRILNSLDSIVDVLDNIDSNLQQVATNHTFKSQSNARDEQSWAFGQHHANFTDYRKNKDSNASSQSRNRSYSDRDIWTDKAKKDFVSRLEKAILDAFGRDTIRKGFQKFMNDIAKQVGRNYGSKNIVDDIENILIKTISNSVKQSGPAKDINKTIENIFNNVLNKDASKGVGEGLGELLKNLKLDENADLTTLFKGLKGIDFGKFGNAVVSGGSAVTDVFTELTSTTTGTIGGMFLVQHATKRLSKAFTLISQGVDEFSKTLAETSSKYEAKRLKGVDLETERLRADVETLITEPFDILKKAANEVYDAWNSNIRLISGAQGYNKEDLQNLMSAYAQRLESEGLSKVVSSTDIYNNLAKVIEAGLTGQGAVEFAYQATRLNAAVPNQDFFSYVESYASVAANAIAAGKSEAEALKIANNSLEEFSNSLLYASRGLTGGYATSLKDAQTTYSAAVKIAQAARSDNISNIANSLLAIQGYVGAIAPDLATSLTDKIYQLATGGNAEDIVALRSLAGINASNTEFLKALATNPQSVLSNMFANLGAMFSQSSDAYMEKAEGYASLFGISAEALQRVDFNSLANAIKQMNTNSDALSQNINLLKEGQTTTTADQLKIEQINRYMIEEGLAYVIDNEAAQLIQQHMWDEQMKRDLIEAEYGVNLIGSAASLLQKIATGIDNIIGIINPAHWFSGAAEIVQSVVEGEDLKADIASVLKAGVVGRGHASDYYNLITRGADLNLTKSLVELLGGESKYGSNEFSKKLDRIMGDANIFSGLLEMAKTKISGQLGATTHRSSSGMIHSGTSGRDRVSSSYGFESNIVLPSSRYTWGLISKSTADLASAVLSQVSGQVSNEAVSNVTGAVSSSTSILGERFKKLLSGDYITQEFIKQGKTFQDWRSAAASQGIVDVDKALKDAGYDPTAVEAYYQAKEVEVGMTEKAEDRAEQKAFYQAGMQFMNIRYWDEYSSPAKSYLASVDSKLGSILTLQAAWRDSEIGQLQNIADNQVNWKEYFNTSWIESVWRTEFVGQSGYFTKFFNEFVNKFVEHTYYDKSGYNYSDVTELQRQEEAEKGSAIYALAEALTGNLVDLKDPQVQTNAILAQILVVVSAIMNQNNNVASTVSLSDALSGLALGLTTSTPFNEIPSKV